MERAMDMRVVKTQRAIIQTFLELMNEIGLSKISVREIIKRAEINRSTFYLHYTDKYDLLDKIEDELLIGLKSLVISSPVDMTSPQEIDDELLLLHVRHAAEYFYENAKSFSLLISDKGDPAFINKLGEVVKFIWIEKKIIGTPTAMQSYGLAAMIGIFTSMVIVWIEKEFMETPEEFTQIFLQMTRVLPREVFFRIHQGGTGLLKS